MSSKSEGTKEVIRSKIRFNPSNVSNEHSLMKRIEYIQAKKQMEQFSTFLPDEVLRFRSWNINELHQFVGVLLLIDISNLINAMDRRYEDGLSEIYKVTTHINCYVGSIIEVLMYYGGDVLSIFATEFLTLWKVCAEESMSEILHNVVVCGNVLQKLLGRYHGSVYTNFKLRVTISSGNICMGVIGIGDTLMKTVLVGDALTSLRLSDAKMKYGNVYITPGAWAHMMQDRYVTQRVEFDFVKVIKIAYQSNELKKKAYYDAKLLAVTSLIEKHVKQRNLLLNAHMSERNLAQNKLTLSFIKVLPVRNEIKVALKYWIFDEMKSLINVVIFTQITESQPVEYLTEMREVTVMFINIQTSIKNEKRNIEKIDACYKIIRPHVRKKLTIMSNVYSNESGMWFKIVFGLRAINHENESYIALKAASAIRKEIETLPDIVHFTCGITTGLNFCSVLGHPYRKEHSVLGRLSYNAKILARNFPGKIICDYQIFRTSKLASFYFLQLSPPADATWELNKIFEDTIIMEFNERFDVVDTPKISHELIGRENKYNLIASIINNPQKEGHSGICLRGPKMMGKSALLRMVSNELKKEPEIIQVLLVLSETSNVPYYAISRIHSKIFNEICRLYNESLEDMHEMPRVLNDFHSSCANLDILDDVNLMKYQCLGNFRHLVKSTPSVIVIIIDNAQHIDMLSWDILTNVFPKSNMRLILSDDSDINIQSNFHQIVSRNANILIIQLEPLHEKYIVPLICQYMKVEAVPIVLVQLIISSCQGVPGKVEICLLRLISTESVIITMENHTSIDRTKYFYNNYEKVRNSIHAFPILNYNDEKFKLKKEELTLDLISLDLFDCLTPFQQLILKTSALLGRLFTRNLLIVTLNYPNEYALAESIKVLFEEEILECGTRVFYSTNMDNEKIYCRCYFEEDFFRDGSKTLPIYAYCKLLHFRNYNVFQVAYTKIPINQRKELHTLCAIIIEKTDHTCPRCIRDPTSSFSMNFTYDEIMEFCTNKNKQIDMTNLNSGSSLNLKDCIRKSVAIIPPHHAYELNTEEYIPIEISMNQCNCLEILCQMYRELIYHTERSDEKSKLTFFTLRLGLVSYLMKDFEGAISHLNKSREICLHSFNKLLKQNLNFKNFIVGKSSMVLASCYLHLRKLTIAKNFMFIALRQYNIPMVSFSYRHLRFLLTKSLIVNVRSYKPFQTTYILKRWELGLILGVCARIFSELGDWKTAKQCIAHSIYMLRSVNTNLPILMDGYCNAIDLHRKYGDLSTCKVLIKNSAVDCQIKYTLSNTHYICLLVEFLINSFNLEATLLENIEKTERKGYRVMYFIRITNFMKMDPEVVVQVCRLNRLSLNYLDYVDNINYLRSLLDKNDMRKILLYYKTCMIGLISTGLHVTPLPEIIRFAEKYLTEKSEYDGYDICLKLLIELEFLRQNRYERALLWQHKINIRQVSSNVFLTLQIIIIYLEINILKWHRALKLRNIQDVSRHKSIIDNLFKVLRPHAKASEYLKIYEFIYKAVCLKINNYGYRARCMLKKGLKLNKKIKVPYVDCLIQQMIQHWNGDFAYNYNERSAVHISQAIFYSKKQKMSFIHPILVVN